MTNPYKGSTFDSFLILEEAEAVAIKRIIVLALQQAMQKQHLTKTEMAEKMHTSRAAIKRLLDKVKKLQKAIGSNQPPRDLAEIDADLDAVSAEIMKLLQEVHS